jgi:hypothetical protein
VYELVATGNDAQAVRDYLGIERVNR